MDERIRSQQNHLDWISRLTAIDDLTRALDIFGNASPLDPYRPEIKKEIRTLLLKAEERNDNPETQEAYKKATALMINRNIITSADLERIEQHAFE